MNINIYGSTGSIGKQTLSLIDKNFPSFNVDLLCAKSNLKLLTQQIKKYRPKYAFLYDHEKLSNFNYKIGKTKFLNMLQGSNPNEYEWWYHKFKHFEFNGWAIGGPQKLVDFMWALALMLKNREFENKQNEYLHLLRILFVEFFTCSTAG